MFWDKGPWQVINEKYGRRGNMRVALKMGVLGTNGGLVVRTSKHTAFFLHPGATRN